MATSTSNFFSVGARIRNHSVRYVQWGRWIWRPVPLSWGRWPSHSLSSRCWGDRGSSLTSATVSSPKSPTYRPTLPRVATSVITMYWIPRATLYPAYTDSTVCIIPIRTTSVAGFTRTMPKASRNSFWKGSAGERRTTLDSRN